MTSMEVTPGVHTPVWRWEVGAHPLGFGGGLEEGSPPSSVLPCPGLRLGEREVAFGSVPEPPSGSPRGSHTGLSWDTDRLSWALPLHTASPPSAGDSSRGSSPPLTGVRPQRTRPPREAGRRRLAWDTHPAQPPLAGGVPVELLPLKAFAIYFSAPPTSNPAPSGRACQNRTAREEEGHSPPPPLPAAVVPAVSCCAGPWSRGRPSLRRGLCSLGCAFS